MTEKENLFKESWKYHTAQIRTIEEARMVYRLVQFFKGELQ